MEFGASTSKGLSTDQRECSHAASHLLHRTGELAIMTCCMTALMLVSKQSSNKGSALQKGQQLH